MLMLCTLSSTAHPAEALEVLIQHLTVVQLQAAEAYGMLCQRQHTAPRHLIAVAEAQHLQPRQLLQVLQQGRLEGMRPKELLACISATLLKAWLVKRIYRASSTLLRATVTVATECTSAP